MQNRPSKIVCVARIYADHAQELGNAVPNELIFFLKPPSALSPLADGIRWNNELGSCHYECELTLRLGKTLCCETDPQKALDAVDAVTLGLDLTLRDVQTALKAKGEPWERAKAYDGSCVIGEWIEVSEIKSWDAVEYRLVINGEIRQKGNTAHFLFSVGQLLCDLSHTFTLEQGDYIMTGTPAGVGALHSSDKIEMILEGKTQDFAWQTYVV